MTQASKKAAAEEPPRRVGPYELIAQLAVGGMARVYLARHTADGGLGRLYAVKVILEHMAGDPDFVQMFHDEARVASRLRHHNIVGVLQQGKYGRKGHYVAMEYIEGCTFGALLRRHPQKRQPELIVSVLIDALHGLHAAHTAVDPQGRPMQVVHRDVSPANVLLDMHGLARISDFGIAKARDRLTKTQPGLYKGRFAYSAPERLVSSQPVDHRADIFSVGAMMWEALAGERLFLGDSQPDTIQRVLKMPIARPSRGRLHPPRCLDAVVLKALQRDPDDRYNTAGEMADDLQRVAAKHGLLCGTAEVGNWVTSTFGKELAASRELIEGSAKDAAETSYFQRDELDLEDPTEQTWGVPTAVGLFERSSATKRARMPRGGASNDGSQVVPVEEPTSGRRAIRKSMPAKRPANRSSDSAPLNLSLEPVPLRPIRTRSSAPSSKAGLWWVALMVIMLLFLLGPLSGAGESNGKPRAKSSSAPLLERLQGGRH